MKKSSPSVLSSSKSSSTRHQPSMRYNKRGFTKINGDDISTSSNGQGSTRINVPKAHSTGGAKTSSSRYQQQEDEGGETDTASINGGMPNEETPLRRRRQDYSRECCKTVWSVVALFVCTLAGAFSIAYIHRFSIAEDHPLPDLIFNVVPWQLWAWESADVVVIVVPLFTFAIILFHKYYSIVFRRLFLSAAALYLIRAAFLLCTFLPPPFPDYKTRCLPANFTDDWVQLLEQAFGLVFKVGFSSNEKRIMCGDTIYSGHTLVFVISCLFMWYYSPNVLRPYPAIITIVGSVFGMTCVIISRQHYTIDVVVAIFVTCAVFYCYQSWTFRSRERRCFSMRPIRFRPLLFVFLYFEGNVPRGRLPNELAWPFPWPDVCVRLLARMNESHVTNIINSRRPPGEDHEDVERRLAAAAGNVDNNEGAPKKTREHFDV